MTKEEVQNNAEIVETVAAEEIVEEKTTAKAGKRSEKAIAEAEEKAAKEARKAEKAEADAEAAEKPKQHANPTRSRLERRGKSYREAAKLVEADKLYTLKVAVALAQKTS